jgi:signal transduction histidine kinase/DNA-binding response OmpR family regulator
MAAELPAQFDDLWTESGLLDVRRQTLREVALSTFFGGLLGTPILPIVFGAPSSAAIGIALALIVVGATIYLLSEPHPHLAVGALLIGLATILLIASAIVPAVALLPWITVVILVAGFLGGPRIGLTLATLATFGLLAGPLDLAAVPASVRVSYAFLFWVGAGLSWLAFRPLLVALSWSWQNYLDVRRANTLLKDHQGELHRTLKSLNETLDRLDQVNHELERARRAANQARQLKSEFAVNVSHELRTPLNLIIGFSEMMVTAPQSYQGQVLPAAYRDDAIAIYRSARHLSDLVDDILDLGQIEAGRMALHRNQLRADAVVAEAMETVQVLFTQKGLNLASCVPADLPPIFADRTRLRQIIINLLSNAVRFTDRGGATVRVALDERDFVFEIADSGAGILPDDLGRIFEEFWQGSDPRRRSGGGGVGLAVSKRFVEMHGGAIWATSAVGEGTTFTFTIPRGSNLPEMGLPRPWDTWARLREANGERPTVVLVTEEPDVRHLFERYLDDHAFVPVGDAAALSALPPSNDLVGAIVVAPDGLTAHRRALAIQVHHPAVPIIACGLTTTHRTIAERLDVADYLLKPIGRDRVAEILHHFDRSIKRLLVVDDDPDAARLLARMIRSVGRRYAVSTVFSGAEGLRAIERDRPDAVFVDLIMPDVDGYTVIEAVRSQPGLANVPIVAVSAQALNVNPLVSDGLVALTPEGMSVSCLLDCVRFSLRRLSGRATEASVPVLSPSETGAFQSPLPQGEG